MKRVNFDTIILYIIAACLFVIVAMTLRYFVSLTPFAIAQVKEVFIADSEILKLEQLEYFEKEQEYKQVLPSETDGSFHINVYESPYGKGYQVVQYFDDRVEYTAYGAGSKEFTYIERFPVAVASSTR